MAPPLADVGRSIAVTSHLPPGNGILIEEEIAEPGKVEITKYFTGPIPSPGALYDYDQALPGTAERIITMAEREALHRHTVEQRMVGIQGRNSTLGIAAGFLVGLAGIGGGVYAVVHGADIAGGGVALTALAALAGIFITQQRAERTEAVAKQETPG